MAIGEVVLELLKGADAKRLNALSMASSGVHNVSQIHMYVLIAYCLERCLINHYVALFLMTTNH